MFVSSPSSSKTHLRRALALTFVALFTALSVTALLPHVASAITKIKDVRVAADADGEGAGEAYSVEEGAKSVFVLFDYSGASRNSLIAVKIVGSSVELFEDEARYEGDGTAAIEITGDALYATMAESIEDLAAELLASSNQVQRTNMTAGQLANDLNVMVIQANEGSIIVPLLEKIDDTDVLENVTRLDKVLGRLSSTLDEALNEPYDAVSERQSILSRTADDARELEGIAEDIALDLQEMQDLPLPMMGPQWSFDVSVRVSEGSSKDNVAGSAFFYVIPAQGASNSEQGSGEPAATATRRDLIGSAARSTRTPPATESSSGSQPAATATTSAGDEGDEDESGSAGEDGESEVDDQGVRASATPRPGATSAPVSASEGSAEDASAAVADSEPSEDEDAPNAEASAAGEGDQDPPVESESGEATGNGASAPPTWTPAAGIAAEAGEEREPGGGGGGPNRAVLLLGVLVLIGAGLWFRRRL